MSRNEPGQVDDDATPAHGADVIHDRSIHGVLTQILRAQERMGTELSRVRERLASGAAALDVVPDLVERERATRDEIVALRTKVAGLMWVCAAFGSAAIAALVAAIVGLLSRHP